MSRDPYDPMEHLIEVLERIDTALARIADSIDYLGQRLDDADDASGSPKDDR